ncbi:MAG TPA: TolC family protein, partial [Bryobacteraceae bacterium]|nr:TolC family protein [Bryobacteraceae bacterium]
MRTTACLLFAVLALARAEDHTLTLRQAMDLAARQNPDIALARLDEMKARAAVRVARDPFLPHVTVGSGLAYSNGFPMSIEGSAPSVVQASATQFLFNRPQSFQVAQAKEDARGAAIAVTGKRDEVAFRIASLYVDAERAGRIGTLARKSIEDQQAILDVVHAQVAEGRALPLAEKQVALNLARARQLSESLEDDRATAETALAMALGFPAEDRVHAVAEDRAAPLLPASEESAVQKAVESSPELRQIESQISSKQLELRGARAGRLPRADLVAQYGMLAKFNNYAEFFNHFQRNNGEIGVAFQLPIFRPGVGSQMAETEVDLSRLKIELANARNRLSADLQQAFRAVRKAESSANVARLDLEVAREQLSVDLAQLQEGRLGMSQVEEARLEENDKWIAFYDAQYALEKSRWNVLRLTGTL